jgi:hypothetical protein
LKKCHEKAGYLTRVMVEQGRAQTGAAPLGADGVGASSPLEEFARYIFGCPKARTRIGELKGNERGGASARSSHDDVMPGDENRTGTDSKRGGDIQVQPRWCCAGYECPAVPAAPDIA